MSCGLEMDFSFSSGSLWSIALQYAVLAAWYDWPGAGQGITLPSPGATRMRQAYREHHVGSTVKFETCQKKMWFWCVFYMDASMAFSCSPLQCCGRWQLVLGLLGLFIIQALDLMRASPVSCPCCILPHKEKERNERCQSGQVHSTEGLS